MLFANFYNETEMMSSPTSILDTKPSSGFKNPFWSECPGFEPNHDCRWDVKLESKSEGVGLGLIDSLLDDNKSGDLKSKPEKRMVVLGSQLKLKIPPLLPPLSLQSSSESQIKTKDSMESAPVLKSHLSASEMELSEDYTRVISHGPNPKTVHIFDGCIINSSCFDVGSSSKENQIQSLPPPAPPRTSYPSDRFLSFCFYCKKDLVRRRIYMYRGEVAFCSRDCRYMGILLDEDGMESLQIEESCSEEEEES
ncbi:protein MARD1 [Senna tora]|uniref:Protein MARD1 n=1 Tax=Senna tora TaxID=362788 RepID=A0A834X489_9FABA|nr:protein MARD1 [Senna tora]